MSQLRIDVFKAALNAASIECAELRDVVEAAAAADHSQISILDDCIEGLLEARNGFCRNEELDIEDGFVSWSTFRLKMEREEKKEGAE